MYELLLKAINALISNKFAEAKRWLTQLISSDTRTTSPGDIAIAHYIYAYICYLENDKPLAIQHYESIDTKLISDKKLLQFLIAPEKIAKTLSNSIKTNNTMPSPQISSSPTVSSSPHFTSPRGQHVDEKKRVVGFIPITTNTNSSSIVSSSFRCVEALQTTPDRAKTNTSDKQAEKFKDYHEFWKYVLKTYLHQLGVPEKTSEKNQPSLEKILTVAAECKIPLYFLCQNLISLSKFWRIDGGTNSDPEVDEELKPEIAPLIIGAEPKTPDAKSPPVRGILAKLLAATPKQSPIATLNGATPKDKEQTPSASTSSSTSGNSKEVAPSNQNASTLLNMSQPINPPVLKTGAISPFQKPSISTPPVPIAIPFAARVETNNTYGATYIPTENFHTSADFLLDEELVDSTLTEENNSITTNRNVMRQLPNPIAHTPKIIQRRESLLANHKSIAESSEKITKAIIDSPPIIPALAYNEYISEINNTITRRNNDSPPIIPAPSIIPTPDKNKIKLKKCIIENNCLAALMLLLSGVSDSADRYEYIPLMPNPTALDLAAYCGNRHCLALIANTTVKTEQFDRALRLAQKHTHIDCIHLLLGHVSFSAKANMYFEIGSSNNPKLQELRQLLLNSHLTLYNALQDDCKILIPELIFSNLSETSDEKNGIILRASELGYDACLTESRLKDADINYINLALINSAKNNHIQCLDILLRLNINIKSKINALISLMRNILDYCEKNLPEDKWLAYFVTEKSFILFLHYLTHIELQETFIEIAQVGDPFFVRVLLKIDRLSLVQTSQSENPLDNRILLKLDNTASLNKLTEKPLSITELQQLDHPNNSDEILKLYNLRKIDKIIHISIATKKTAFSYALKQWKIDIVIALFNTGLDIKDEEDAVKKIAAGSNINYKGKLVAYALNNPFTLALLIKLKLNLPSKTALGVIHKVTELANLDCLKLLLDNGFDINKVDEFPLTKQTSSSASATTNNPASPNVLSMSSFSSLKNITQAASADKTITVSTGTIVMIASYLGHTDCLEYLLNRGTGLNDPRNPPDLRIQLPANCYFKSQRLTVTTHPTIYVSQNNTITNSTDEINTCYSGYSALHFAVNSLNCLELLIQAIQLQENKNLKEEELSLKKGQIIKRSNFKKEMLALKTTMGDTALHIAALNNQCKSIHLLLKSGADPYQVNKQNEIPMVSAIRVAAKDAYQVFIDNKAIFENQAAPIKVLKEMFESSLKLNNIARLSIITDCLFSAKINWSNQVELIELFQSLLHIIVRHNNFEALQVFKLYINKYFKLDTDDKEESLEFLGELYISLSQRENYMKIIQFAINSHRWKIAKSLLEHISSQQHFKAASHLNDKDAVIFLLRLNELIDLIPKEEKNISLNLNP